MGEVKKVGRYDSQSNCLLTRETWDFYRDCVKLNRACLNLSKGFHLKRRHDNVKGPNGPALSCKD